MKLLPLAQESFVGSKLIVNLFPVVFLPRDMVPDVQNQMRHLMENVFCKLSSVMFYNGDYWLKSSSQVLHTKGISNCNKLGFFLDRFQICIEDTIRVLRDWLQNSSNHEHESSITKKRLTLRLLPRPAILTLSQQLKQEFEKGILPSFEFVINFEQNLHERGALSENEVFSVTNSSTNMSISLFNCKLPNGFIETRFTRLWHRRIVSKDEDSAMFNQLETVNHEDYED
ncbi:hypothetical protein Ddc_15266 [Ditylenchus destructor]|nr:hypothetical protein Ddc_15266 [Ditylenchus destructor]